MFGKNLEAYKIAIIALACTALLVGYEFQEAYAIKQNETVRFDTTGNITGDSAIGIGTDASKYFTVETDRIRAYEIGSPDIPDNDVIPAVLWTGSDLGTSAASVDYLDSTDSIYVTNFVSGTSWAFSRLAPQNGVVLDSFSTTVVTGSAFMIPYYDTANSTLIHTASGQSLATDSIRTIQATGFTGFTNTYAVNGFCDDPREVARVLDTSPVVDRFVMVCTGATDELILTETNYASQLDTESLSGETFSGSSPAIQVDTANNAIWVFSSGSTFVYNYTSTTLTLDETFTAPVSQTGTFQFGNYIISVEDLSLRVWSKLVRSQHSTISLDFDGISCTLLGGSANFANGKYGVGCSDNDEAFVGDLTALGFGGGGSAGGSGGEQSFCINLDGDPEAELCFEDTPCDPDTTSDDAYCGDGIPDNNTGFGSITGPQQNTTQSANSIACAIGLIDDCDSDIKFNGVGYLVTIIMFGIMISMFYIGSGGHITQIPTFVWFISSIGVLGASAGLGFTDATFFVIGIIVVIAIGASKVLSQIEFGGFR